MRASIEPKRQRTNLASPSVRFAATQIVHDLLSAKASLATSLPHWLEKIEPQDRALLTELSYGVARWSIRLSAIMQQLMERPLREKDQDVAALIQVGLYQLAYTRIPEYAAIDTTVRVALELRKKWARGLVNAVLRNYQRNQSNIDRTLSADEDNAFPQWLADRLRCDWPSAAADIIRLSNQHPPMILRVNQSRMSALEYVELLKHDGIAADKTGFTDHAVKLAKPISVDRLPAFADGCVSVQDSAAQLAAVLLQPQDNERIVDACAAPGGKTCHLLELAPRAKVVALDISEPRLQRVAENAARLSVAHQIELQCADAALLDSWWDGTSYDAVLLDAPCSGTGVLRRHPDIKLMRRASDIDSLCATQWRLMESLWQVVAPGGRMLYVTCSLLKQENEQLVQRFLQKHTDAKAVEFEDLTWGEQRPVGRQLQLTTLEADGFYYCLLRKCA